MSLLHRQLIASAFTEMLKKIEPIVKDTAESVVQAVAPAPVAAVATAAIEVADQMLAPAPAPTSGAITSDHVDAAVATPAQQTLPGVQDKNSAALAAVQALSLQLSQIATQLAAIQSNLQ